MRSADAPHDLLPWFATGTLSDEESQRFREHLEGCPACREELETVRELQEEIERQGEAMFEEHPSPRQLVDAVRGDLDEAGSETVRRHLALCASCATEAGWVRGTAVAGAPTRRRPGPTGAWRWFALGAAAAAVVALMVLPLLPDRDELTGLVAPSLVVPTERGSGPTRIAMGGEGQGALLLFEIDLAAASFPVAIEIRPSGGTTLYRREGILRSELLSASYLVFHCDARDCTPGRYDVIVDGTGETKDELRFSFEIAETPDDAD